METQGIKGRDVYDKIKQLEIFLEACNNENDRKKLEAEIATLKKRINQQ